MVRLGEVVPWGPESKSNVSQVKYPQERAGAGLSLGTIIWYPS